MKIRESYSIQTGGLFILFITNCKYVVFTTGKYLKLPLPLSLIFNLSFLNYFCVMEKNKI